MSGLFARLTGGLFGAGAIAAWLGCSLSACSLLNEPADPIAPPPGAGPNGECVASACPGEDTSCRSRACNDGACGFDAAPAGAPCELDGEAASCDGDGACVALDASCRDGEQNDDESDVDCGGSCPSCPMGDSCRASSDCVSLLCEDGTCTACGAQPDCADLADHYCDVASGVCLPLKAAGASCGAASECATGFCPAEDGVCCDTACAGTCESCGTAGICGDVQDGQDPDDDCGLDACNGAGSCRCSDGEQSGDEDGLDCGGSACAPCGATCADLLTSENVWGGAATGFDLRNWTNGTLHWIGCSTAVSSCAPGTWYCTYDAAAQRLTFGSPSVSPVRAVIDPGDQQTALSYDTAGCCSAVKPGGSCNAPDANGNGSGIDTADALCHALGYANGTLVRQVIANTCPQAHATQLGGSSWTSDFVQNSGFGAEWMCEGFE